MQFLEQQQEVAARLRLDLNVTEQATSIKRWINQSQQEIWSRCDWPFAFDREIVQTEIDKTAGTVSISVSGQTVTGSGTAFASGDVGKFIQMSSSNDWYKITAVASPTSLTIEAPYVVSSALSGGSYTIRKFFYNVSSSVEKIMTVRQTISPVKLTLIPFRKFDTFVPSVESSENPHYYIVWGYDSSNRWTFTPHPTPSQVLNLEIRFKKKATDLSADTDESVIPSKWHHVLVEGALYRGLEHVRTDDTDKRAEFKQQTFEKMLTQMIGDSEPTNDQHTVIMNRDIAMIPRGPCLPEDFGPRR